MKNGFSATIASEEMVVKPELPEWRTPDFVTMPPAWAAPP